MGLFTELYALTRHTRLAMLVTADHDTGRMTICVMPRAQPGAQTPLSTDLTLTATPAEFDADFVAALTGYSRQLVPLLEQAAAASKALEEAKQTPQRAAPAPRAKACSTPASPHASTSSTVGSAVPAQATPATETPLENPNDDPDRDWMKNRQPELF